jgi:hypothetical protein
MKKTDEGKGMGAVVYLLSSDDENDWPDDQENKAKFSGVHRGIISS